MLEHLGVDIEPEVSTAEESQDPLFNTKQKIKAALVSLSASPQSRQPSHSVVLEAAASAHRKQRFLNKE